MSCLNLLTRLPIALTNRGLNLERIEFNSLIFVYLICNPPVKLYNMPYSASLIAYAFVKKGIEESNPVTQMKLQKMVYFAHGIHLALYNEPLINENFQAWKYGPVIPDIYQSYKFYGSSPIADTDWLSFTVSFNKDLDKLDSKAIESINYTWNALKNINAVKLSNWTHKDGSPWKEVYIDGINDTFIPNDSIAKYFQQYLVH